MFCLSKIILANFNNFYNFDTIRIKNTNYIYAGYNKKLFTYYIDYFIFFSKPTKSKWTIKYNSK